MMAWQKYELVFRLLAPMHIGCRTAGNLMQSRGYVPGNVLWAALTARLTRDNDNGADGQRYVAIGQLVQEYFRFTYLYPATKNGTCYKSHYPWDEDFDYLFQNSYASTALNYESQSAEEAMLHETEFIAPHTRTDHTVYLVGNLYANTELPKPLDKWQDALEKLQLGAERGYGWGRVKKICCDKLEVPFSYEPTVELHNGDRITAHLKAAKVTGIVGPIEPLIGWERNNSNDRKNNWRLSDEAIICYAPGAKVTVEGKYTIGHNGVCGIN
ncbi:MAG: hypothetical protein HGB35_05670 [Geobacteraceae bacterium]|nr:hypothetical protein [Geobacteraceae bacterium]